MCDYCYIFARTVIMSVCYELNNRVYSCCILIFLTDNKRKFEMYRMSNLSNTSKVKKACPLVINKLNDS